MAKLTGGAKVRNSGQLMGGSLTAAYPKILLFCPALSIIFLLQDVAASNEIVFLPLPDGILALFRYLCAVLQGGPF
jgi:hypothetical protein